MPSKATTVTTTMLTISVATITESEESDPKQARIQSDHVIPQLAKKVQNFIANTFAIFTCHTRQVITFILATLLIIRREQYSQIEHVTKDK